MKRFNIRNMKIGWKYGLILVIVFILFGASTVIVSNLVSKIGDNIEELDIKSDRAIKVTEMGSLTRAKYIRVLRYQQDPNSQFFDEYEERRARFNELEAEIIDKMDTEGQVNLFNQIVSNDKEMNDLFTEKLVQAKENDDTGGAAYTVSEINEIQLESVAYLDELVNTLNEERDLAVKEAKTSQQLTLNVLIISMLISIVLGGLLVFLISRVVSRNLNKVVQVANQIADGDLDVNVIDYDGKDEIGGLVKAMNTMSHNLRQIIQEVSSISGTLTSHSEELTQSSHEVRQGSQQVASTMQELASGTETQATHASSLSTTMDTFAAKMDEANSFGVNIYQSSDNVVEMTNKGGQLMEASVQQMGAIDRIVQDAVTKVRGLDTKSQEITNLVHVVKDIAEQTNLLALNAAIEAARAGEHGRGFAVVADEVRKLAEQVSDSIAVITDIVTSIQAESTVVAESLQGGYKEVEKGTNQMKSTGETFNEIKQAINVMVDNVKNITNNLSDMSTDSKEMVVAIQEIASVSEEAAAGVEQTAASTEQASSSMEEVAKSSEELSSLAEKLNEVVRTFKL